MNFDEGVCKWKAKCSKKMGTCGFDGEGDAGKGNGGVEEEQESESEGGGPDNSHAHRRPFSTKRVHRSS
ncbi:hypothetical protein LWI28_029221 [Acer negundo]|uniref:Uncharacterized protein n=1 Tax=Acer negundo TaxID=4023 RepID=A0AAD5NWK2_ACENE|nr:hypothetical protein LWI28_029221 [Acer negundo]